MRLPFNFSDRAPEIINRLIPRYNNITPEESDGAIGISYLGTHVYSNLEFLKISGTSLDSAKSIGSSDGNSEVMLRVDTVLMAVTQTKIIIRTEIQGRKGTVKEYISDGDYMINIRGAIMSEFPNVYPREQIELLIELLTLSKAIPVASGFLDLFSITDIVVENFSVAEKMGSRNEVPFEINALSDEPIEFALNA